MNRRLRLRWLLACLASLLALPACWIAVAECQHWLTHREIRQRQSSRTARIATLWRERPSLLGTATPGNAWDDYLPAIEMLEAIPGIREVWRRSGSWGDPVPAAPPWWHPDMEPEIQAAIARIKRGALRQSTLASPERTLGEGRERRGRLHLALLVLAADASTRRTQGDLVGATENLLGALQLALDGTSPPGYVGGSEETMLWHLDAITEELGKLIVDPRLDDRQLARISAALQVGDSQIAQVADEADAGVREFVDREYPAALARGIEMPWDAIARWMNGEADPRDGFPNDERAMAARVEILRNAGTWTAAELHQNLAGDKDVQSDPADWPRQRVPEGWEWTERLHRSAKAELRVYRALALNRLGVGPGNPAWPSDPCTMQPLRLEKTLEGAEVVTTSPQWCPQFYGDCITGPREYPLQVRTGK